MLAKLHPTILFRKSLGEESEFDICKSVIPGVVEYRSMIPRRSLVAGRYSVLPFYKELEEELALADSKLINSYEQHCYIANITNYYLDLKDYTPRTWDTWYNLPDDKSFIIKGKTNSRKHQFNSLMFCEDKKAVSSVASRLMDDTFINEQGLVVREYVPLETYEIGINGLPITNEWRVFCWKDKIIDYGYYWVSHPEHKDKAKLDSCVFDLLGKVIPIVSKNINFYVIDIAKTQSGDWIIIELNDGQMSGLSCIEPYKFYSNLRNCMYEA